MGFKNQYDTFQRYVKPLLDEGLLALTVPEKPTSQNQQYRTSSKGVAFLKPSDNPKFSNLPL